MTGCVPPPRSHAPRPDPGPTGSMSSKSKPGTPEKTRDGAGIVYCTSAEPRIAWLLYPRPRAAAAAGLRHPRSHRRSARPSSGRTYHTFCRCHCHARVLRRVAHRRDGAVSTARAARVVVGPGPWRHQRRYQSDRIGRVTCLGNAPLALARWARLLELRAEAAVTTVGRQKQKRVGTDMWED